MSGSVPGPDGRLRCPWALSGAELYLDYHDTEWGRPVHGDTALYERLTLEGFQSGLSWITILRKRPRFRTVFAGFDPEIVAGFGPEQVETLMADAGIVRNRAKIEAAVGNARAVLALRATGSSLEQLVWSFAPAAHARPHSVTEVPPSTSESVALSRALRAHGFRFIGPTTAYATMQACGLVDDHLSDCVAGL